MGPERLELSQISPLDPKSSASTSFATGPYSVFIFQSALFLTDFLFISPASTNLSSDVTFSHIFVGRVPQALILFSFLSTKDIYSFAYV